MSTVSGTNYLILVSYWTSSANPGGTFDLEINCNGVWTGDVDTDWATGGNWSNGVQPTGAQNAYIPTNPTGGNFPIIGSAGLADDLGVASLATVNVLAGNSLTVNGVLTNNGTINVASGGSLVQAPGSTVAGSGTYNVTRVGSAVYDFWSSPITNANSGILGSPYIYSPALGTVDPADDEHDPGWISGGATMIVAKGYAAHGAGTRTFSGTVNNGNITIAMQSFGAPNVNDNLIGNPYPSGLNANQFLTDNSLINTLYFWDDPGVTPYASADYASYTSFGGSAGGGGNTPTGTIGSVQGFMVKASGNGNAVFNNAQRTAANTSILFRLAETKRLWLSVSNTQNYYNQTLVGFIDDGTDGVDPAYDAPKLNSLSDLSLYSFIGSEPYAINAYGPLTEDRIVALGMNSGFESVVTFTLDDLDNMESDFIILEDRYLGVFQDLQEGDYSCQVSIQHYTDRFYLHFSEASITGLMEAGKEGGMHAYMDDETLTIRTSEDMIANVEIIDVSGRVVMTRNKLSLNSTGIQLNLSRFSDGVYLVKVISENGILSQKILK